MPTSQGALRVKSECKVPEGEPDTHYTVAASVLLLSLSNQYYHAHRLGALDSLPPNPEETGTGFCSWSQCASWRWETSGMLPPRHQICPLEKGPVPGEVAGGSAEGERRVAHVRGPWEPRRAAGPLGLLPLSQGRSVLPGSASGKHWGVHPQRSGEPSAPDPC